MVVCGVLGGFLTANQQDLQNIRSTGGSMSRYVCDRVSKKSIGGMLNRR